MLRYASTRIPYLGQNVQRVTKMLRTVPHSTASASAVMHKKIPAMLMDENGTMAAWRERAFINTNVMCHTLSPFEASIAAQRFAAAVEKQSVMYMSEDGNLAGWRGEAELIVTGCSWNSLPPDREPLAFLAGAFEELDLDHNGVLDRDELRAGLIRLGLPADD